MGHRKIDPAKQLQDFLSGRYWLFGRGQSVLEEKVLVLLLDDGSTCVLQLPPRSTLRGDHEFR